jgi:hypothetical protein
MSRLFTVQVRTVIEIVAITVTVSARAQSEPGLQMSVHVPMTATELAGTSPTWYTP